MTPNGSRLDALDLMRGVAALLVLAGHLRAYVFQSYGELTTAQNVAVKGFYFLTSLGHEAVVVFFALSGYLVGGKALADLLSGKFAWPHYLLRRLTRLSIVIGPALLLTFVLDLLGMMLTGGAGYDGRYKDLLASGPTSDAPVSHGLWTLIGNLAFLQTVFVPVFGSNGPMWSLSNEFWYYLFCPLTVWIIVANVSYPARALGVAFLVAMALVLPVSFVEGGLVWAAGALAARASADRRFSGWFGSLPARIVGLAALVAVFPASRGFPGVLGDLSMGLIIAAILPVLAHLPSLGRIGGAVSRGTSEISYTLYLTHFPLLTFAALSFITPVRFPPGLAGFGLYGLLFAACILSAVVLWWLFESRTDAVYRALARRLPQRKTQAAASAAHPSSEPRKAATTP